MGILLDHLSAWARRTLGYFQREKSDSRVHAGSSESKDARVAGLEIELRLVVAEVARISHHESCRILQFDEGIETRRFHLDLIKLARLQFEEEAFRATAVGAIVSGIGRREQCFERERPTVEVDALAIELADRNEVVS